MADIGQVTIENTIPVLAVANVQASIDFYCDKLGFQSDWSGGGETPQIASVSRGGHAIMLQCREPLTSGCVWIGLEGFESLWKRIRADGTIAVVERPTNQPWALEMKIEDPDGNILWFGTEPLEGVPFGQEPAQSGILK